MSEINFFFKLTVSETNELLPSWTMFIKKDYPRAGTNKTKLVGVNQVNR